MTNEKIIWNYLKEQGYSDAGCAGILGNLYAESSLNPINLQNTFEKKLGMTDRQYCNAVDNGTYTNFIHDSAGWGLAQWTFWSRKQNFYQLCQSKNKSIGDLLTQLDFLQLELTTGYQSLVNLLKTTNSVYEASTQFLLQFERPADQSDSMKQRRASYAQGYYDKYHKERNMKYNNSNRPLICMLSNSTCYKGTHTMQPVGILWHSTGVNNNTLKRYVQPIESDPNYNYLMEVLGDNRYNNDYNHITINSGLNAFVGKLADGTVAAVQTMPWNYAPWGCGRGNYGSCNDAWIQFEICEDHLTDEKYFNEAYEEACQLTAYLCAMYGINPQGSVQFNGITVPTILCHADSHQLGLGSNHSDIYNWFPKFDKDMNDVRRDVAAIMASNSEQIYNDQDDEDMTQEKFNEMMQNYLNELSEEPATWENAAMQWAVQNGLLQGDEHGRLMPKKFMTRGEFMTVLQRYDNQK